MAGSAPPDSRCRAGRRACHVPARPDRSGRHPRPARPPRHACRSKASSAAWPPRLRAGLAGRPERGQCRPAAAPACRALRCRPAFPAGRAGCPGPAGPDGSAKLEGLRSGSQPSGDMPPGAALPGGTGPAREARIHRGHRSRRTQPPEGRHGTLLRVCRAPAGRRACAFARFGPGGWYGTWDGRWACSRKSGTPRTGELAAPRQRRPGRGHVPGRRSRRGRRGERGKRIGNALHRIVRQPTFRHGRRFPRWSARRSDLSPGYRPGHRRHPDPQAVRAGPGTRRGLAAPAAVARSSASSPAGHRGV